MAETGAGGVIITRWVRTDRFKKDFLKLAGDLPDRVMAKLKDLHKVPIPPGLEFEKLKGYQNPDIYTIHVGGNCKVSMEIEGSIARLRRVGTHKEIDRFP